MKKFAKKKLKGGHPKRPEKTEKSIRVPRKAIKGGTRVRNICFTIWDPTPDEKEHLSEWQDELPKDVQYAIGQLENVPRGDHIQGYVEFTRRMVLSNIKTLFNCNRMHVETRYGTQAEAIVYCKKADTRVEGDNAWRFECGTPKAQGRRKDSIIEAVQQLDEGMNLDDLDENYPVQMTLHKNKLIDRYIEKKGPRSMSPNKKNVYILTGPSGSGKSTTARKKFPDAYQGVWPTGGRWWWPNYRGQETVIFDEFRENLSYQQMLALLDIHPMSIEYKGGNTQMVSKRIIITTIRDPCAWYPGVEDKSELERRINENATIVDFSPKGKYPNFIKKKRTEAFEFNEYVPQDY